MTRASDLRPLGLVPYYNVMHAPRARLSGEAGDLETSATLDAYFARRAITRLAANWTHGIAYLPKGGRRVVRP